MKRSGEGIVENRSDKYEYYRHKVNKAEFLKLNNIDTVWDGKKVK